MEKFEDGPALADDQSTIEQFNGALSKAKLLYNEVIVEEGYQVAIARNVTRAKTENILIYADKKDGKVYNKTLPYFYTNFTSIAGYVPMMGCKPGSITAGNEDGTERCLLSYDGQMIIPFTHKDIYDIHQKLLFCGLDISLFQHGIDTHGAVYNYNGDMLISFRTAQIKTATMGLDKNGLYAILTSKSKKKRFSSTEMNTVQMYIVDDGILYSFLEYPRVVEEYSIEVSVFNSKIRLAAYDGMRYREVMECNRDDAVRRAYKVEPGKEPIFSKLSDTVIYRIRFGE